MAQPITLDDLVALLAARPPAPRSLIPAPRSLIAIAGPPGVGKSTVAATLADALNRARPGVACVLSADGYHLDDGILRRHGWLARKGAAHTFDVAGLAHMLGRLRADDEATVFVPVFDRALEISRAGAGEIPRAARLVLVEGNYLLTRGAPWAGLRGFFDLTVMLQARPEVLRARLRARWRALGLPEAEAMRKLAENDLPNVQAVLSASGEADFTLRTDADTPD